MKAFTIFQLLIAVAFASPLLSERQQLCLDAGITPARAAEVRNAFQSAGLIGVTVPDIRPTTDLIVRYGNINENLGNTFDVVRK